MILYCYIAAAALAMLLVLLWPAKWHRHVAAALLGLGVGLIPPPAGIGGNLYFLIVGVVSVFLLVWGFGGLLFRRG